MMRLVPRVRASYPNGATSNANEHELATKMLLDGCFVLHRLLKHAGEGGDDDWTTWTQTQLLGQSVWEAVRRDLLLLSSQVPFFVIRTLFKHLRSNGEHDRDDILVDGGLQLFSSIHPRRLHNAPIAYGNVHHLLHLFYLSIDFPPSSSSPSNSKDMLLLPNAELTCWVPCANDLFEAGVRIRARTHGARSFHDVRFRRGRGILEIPQLQLFDYSEPLFRNLIAFEQTNPAIPDHITAYTIFMDCLVKTPEDVRLLRKIGVLVNQMNGNRDDTAFFSRLCAGVHTYDGRNYLAGIMEEVLRYQRSKCPQLRAALARDFYTTLSVILFPVVFLVLTVMQTFYTVYPYYKPYK